MTPRHMRILILTAALALGLQGCATNPANGDAADPYGQLKGEGSDVGYATAFPVGSPGEAYSNGEQAMRDGNLDRALFEYLRGLRLEEEPSAEPLYRIGSIHHQRKDHPRAELAYRWALELDPEHQAAQAALGIMLLETRRHEAAEESLSAVAERGTESWRVHNALGILADLKGASDEAERHYDNALVRSRNNAVVLNNLGYSRYLAGDWAGARRALTRALRRSPNYEQAWRNLGLVHARDGEYEQALDAVRRTGSESDAYNDVGYIAMLDGRYEDAEALFQEAMRLSPAFFVTASENAEDARRRIRRARLADPARLAVDE